MSDVLVFEEDSLPCVPCSVVLNPDVMASVVLPGWAKVEARLGVCLPSFSVGGTICISTALPRIANGWES